MSDILDDVERYMSEEVEQIKIIATSRREGTSLDLIVMALSVRYEMAIRMIAKLREHIKDTEIPSNAIVIRKLPWICGNCAKESVQNISLYKGGPELIGRCDNCGAEWVS